MTFGRPQGHKVAPHAPTGSAARAAPHRARRSGRTVRSGRDLDVDAAALDAAVANRHDHLLGHLGLGSTPSPPTVDALVWDLRLPRSLLAMLLGT